MALASSTHIPTPFAWKSLGKLKPGDRVFDQDGRLCFVVAACPAEEQPVYQVRFDGQCTLVAGGGQPWVTLTHARRHKIHRLRFNPRDWTSVLSPPTTEDIMGCPTYERGTTLKECMHSIPLALPLGLRARSLPIDPYLMGLWLGDGTSREAAITCHFEDEPHYRKRALAAGERWRIRAKKENALTCVLSKGPEPLFLRRLASLDLWNNKHVPMRYLRAGDEQRLALLQGLMDSDGYINGRSGAAEFTSTLEVLARGTMELLLTLGQKPSISRGDARLHGRWVSDKWRVTFSPSIMAVSLPRKVEMLERFLEQRTAPALSSLDQRYIRSVEPLGGVSTTSCVEVDSESGLFLAGRRMIPVSGHRRVSSG